VDAPPGQKWLLNPRSKSAKVDHAEVRMVFENLLGAISRPSLCRWLALDVRADKVDRKLAVQFARRLVSLRGIIHAILHGIERGERSIYRDILTAPFAK
jgi:hypothetical protein